MEWICYLRECVTLITIALAYRDKLSLFQALFQLTDVPDSTNASRIVTLVDKNVAVSIQSESQMDVPQWLKFPIETQQLHIFLSLHFNQQIFGDDGQFADIVSRKSSWVIQHVFQHRSVLDDWVQFKNWP